MTIYLPIPPIALVVLLSFNTPICVLAQEAAQTTSQKIQSADHAVALKGVAEAESRRDTSSLILGLKHPNSDVVLQSVDAIRALDSQEAVIPLIETWKANQDIATGGSGERIAQKQLYQKLAKTLAQLTGQPVDQKQELTQAQMEQIVQSSKDWAAKHS